MMQPDYVNAVLANPQHPVNLALADNDTYKDWLPEAPMRILYCMADDQVPFRNSIVARDALTAIGAPDFQAQDVLPTGDHGDCYVPAMTGTLFFFLACPDRLLCRMRHFFDLAVKQSLPANQQSAHTGSGFTGE